METDFAGAKTKYDSAVNVIKVLLVKIIKEEQVNSYINEIVKTINILTEQLMLSNDLLELETQEYPAEDYIPRHLVNVCILSLAIGIQLKFNRQELQLLGVASIFYDVSLIFIKDIILQPKKLSEEEQAIVREHVLKSAEIVSSLGEPYNKIKEIIQQHHERIDGKGYPSGLKNEAISIHARIIGLTDTYEAMTHFRAHLKGRLPHQVIREIVSTLKQSFDAEILKAFFSKISFYPIGSFGKLNTGEVAKVISSNPESPLRPIVLVMVDMFGNYISEPEKLDLSKKNSVYIIDSVEGLP